MGVWLSTLGVTGLWGSQGRKGQLGWPETGHVWGAPAASCSQVTLHSCGEQCSPGGGLLPADPLVPHQLRRRSAGSQAILSASELRPRARSCSAGRRGGAGTTDSGISDPDASRAGGAPGAWAQRAHTVGSGQCPSPTCSSEASYFRAWNSVSGASLPSLTRQAPLGSGGRGPASMRSLHLAGASSAGTPPRGKFPAGVGGLLLADH